jgi:GNAT superfamily N-acetyltransferase
MMEPWGCFVAEEHDGRIVGVALAAAWGAIGVVGPVAVLTNHQNQGIAQQLLAAVDDFFEENKTALQGVVTYPTSAKHLMLYHRLGYRPKGLSLVMSRALDRKNGGAPPAAAVAKTAVKAMSMTVRRYSTLEEAKKKATLARIHRITNGVSRGLDLAKEIEIVDGLALGDTLLVERGRDLIGFAIYHVPGVSEAPVGALYVKFLALDPAQKRTELLEQFIGAVEDLAMEAGLTRVIVPVYLRYFSAYSTLVKCGYQIDMTMVRMQRGKQEDYEDATHLVLDDWR